MILGLVAGVVTGLKTKVFRMLGALAALFVSATLFVIIVNESLVGAMAVAIFMILSASAVIFYKWFQYKGFTIIVYYFLAYCEAMAAANRLLLENPKEKTDDKQKKNDS